MSRREPVSERRTEHLLGELLAAQGWSLARPPRGDLLRQQEYRVNRELSEIFSLASKTGKHHGLPEAVLVDRLSVAPLAVIEAKANKSELQAAMEEAKEYADHCVKAGHFPLAIGIAGTSEDDFDIRVFRWQKTRWVPVTYEGKPINWIPNPDDLRRVASAGGPSELRPTIPPSDVLAERADEINRLLRESGVIDQKRPAVVGAIMLGLWESKGQIRKDPEYILGDLNAACEKAFRRAKKEDLASSLHIDDANQPLAIKARRIVNILERFNVTVLSAEYDYLGQLYETFFRYTGGNTIGQYFTPRHIANLMADLCEVSSQDIILDPACGTGGFLIASMNRMLESEGLSRTKVVKVVKSQLLGFDQEPLTAALCVANMILRGDGTTGVRRGDCFTSDVYPVGKANIVLMNPPFPHKNTDVPPERFVDRALEGLSQRGQMAAIVPMDLLVGKDKGSWRQQILSKHTLEAIITLPDELFQPYAAPYTNILMIRKGVPHNFTKKVFFARIDNDGLRLRKGVRLPRPGSQIDQVKGAYKDRSTVLGLCGWSVVAPDGEWRPGAYIPARPLTESEVLEEVGTVVRSGSALVVKHAPSVARLSEELRSGRLVPRDFHEYVGSRTFAPTPGETIGKYFEIFYGQKELEAKDSLGPGTTPVISSSGEDNGCHGFYAFDWLIAPPIVTAPRTGSIGKAHVQTWPCGASSDNLILVPRAGVKLPLLYVAAAVIRRERWRFNYGSKLTPDRIAGFPLPTDEKTLSKIAVLIRDGKRVEAAALKAADANEEVTV